MVNRIKTFDERKEELIKEGKEKGFITFEQLAEKLKGLDVDADSLDDLYNTLTENGIEIFYPCKINFKIATINTGSKVEKFLNKTFKILIWVLIVYNILLLLGFSIFDFIK